MLRPRFGVAAALLTIAGTGLGELSSAVGPHYSLSDAPRGRAFVTNYCAMDFYAYHVTDLLDPRPEDGIALKAGSEISFPVIIPERGCECGVAIKIFGDRSKSGKVTQMEYSVKDVGDRKDWFVSYDVSFVDCASRAPGTVDGLFNNYTGVGCPGWDQGVKVYGVNGGGCGVMQCAQGRFCPWDAYFEPQPAFGTQNPYQPVRQCAIGAVDVDVHFVLCSGTTSDGGDPAAPSYRMPTPDDGPNHASLSPSRSLLSPSLTARPQVTGFSVLASDSQIGAAPVAFEVTATMVLLEEDVPQLLTT